MPIMSDMNIKDLALPEIREVYREQLKHDFPDNERRPLSMIEKLLAEGRYYCCGIRDESGVSAYAFFVRHEETYLADYIAVRKDLRGTGIGSAFLQELRSRFREAACVLLEVDDPDAVTMDEEKAVRLRRLHFYRKNGLRDTGARARTFGADYLIMEFPEGEAHDPAEAGKIYAGIYLSVLPEWLFDRMVKITPDQNGSVTIS